jgi:hypothetical protein
VDGRAIPTRRRHHTRPPTRPSALIPRSALHSDLHFGSLGDAGANAAPIAHAGEDRNGAT